MKSEPPITRYMQTLVKDLKEELKIEGRKKLTSIFFGGGTPSLIPGTSLSNFFSAIEREFDLSNVEITLEANPGTYDLRNFRKYIEIGVNRLSIGAQTFDQSALEKLGRTHSSLEITEAFGVARKVGFENINLDIMYGLPAQKTFRALEDLERAIDLNPEHISWYELTIEPNTIFFSQQPSIPSEKVKEDMFHLGREKLAAAGYKQYEVSAYSKTGKESQHNINYWKFGDYLGIGAGAHGKITSKDRIIRTRKTRNPVDYLERYNAIKTEVCKKEVITEFLINALRLVEGFELSMFEERCNKNRSDLEPFIEKGISSGFLNLVKDKVVPTTKGHLFLNELMLLI
tara:strand:+ start:125 stop:1156 length:1032 start_codon:yes stop_codon:yes gene_type:complete